MSERPLSRKRQHRFWAFCMVIAVGIAVSLWFLLSSSRNAGESQRDALGPQLDNRAEGANSRPLTTEKPPPTGPSSEGVEHSEVQITLTEDRIIHLLRANTIRHYPELAAGMTTTDLDVCAKILSNAKHSGSWRRIINLLSFVEESPFVSETLIQFAESDASELNSVHPANRLNVFWPKTYAIKMLGRTGDDRANEYLRQAITEKGAKELAAAWLDDLWETDRYESASYFIHRVRADALIGLAFTQESQNLALLKSQYESLHKEVQSKAERPLQKGETQRPITDKEADFELLYGSAADAMGIADLIGEMGMERFIQDVFLADGERQFEFISSASAKYYFPIRDYTLRDLVSP